MNCNNKIANPLIFKELALLALSVVITEGKDDISIEGSTVWLVIKEVKDVKDGVSTTELILEVMAKDDVVSMEDSTLAVVDVVPIISVWPEVPVFLPELDKYVV